jgi:HAMP domain-containing protein
VSYRSAQAEDVTATYIDTQARIGPARDSITRVRALMAKATDLQQLLVLESELTRRQSDLDALTQQLADLDKRTTMSQVTVAMWTPAAAAVVDEGTGVVGGLRGAWEALLGSLTVVLTGLAVLLPWLLLIGLGALIALRVVRRRRATAAASAPPTSPATVSNPPTPGPTPAATTAPAAGAPTPSSTD